MNTTDLLKSCTTNVRVVEDLFDAEYTVYIFREADHKLHNQHRAVSHLRKHKVICAAVKEELWVFGPSEPELKQLLEDQTYFVDVQDGADIGSHSSRRGADGRTMKDIFLEAIEGAIAYTLATRHGAIHAGSFKWLFLDSEAEETEAGERGLVEMHVNLSQSGTLYFSTTAQNACLDLFQDAQVHMDASLVLAPSGRYAKLVSEVGDGDVAIRKPTAFSSSDLLWQSVVSETLFAEGVELESDEIWLLVETDAQNRVLWPASLCLTAIPRSKTGSRCSLVTHDWTYWFGAIADVGLSYKYPLAAAEEWFVGAAEREKAANVTTENNTLEHEDSLFAPTTIIAETPLATSPPFNQRVADQQAALAGIYPTPPDGLVPGHVQHQTSDGIPGAMQIEHTSLNNDLQLPSSDDSQPGRHSLESSSDANAYQPNSDDLFGDIGEMEFGANEVGDADFDYFDEPDDSPQADPMAQDIEMVDIIQDIEHGGTVAKVGQDVSPDEAAMISEEHVNEDSSRSTSSHDIPLITADLDIHDDQGLHASKSPGQDSTVAVATNKEPEKPLSPFGIRERLLPLPIPASVVSQNTAQSHHNRRSSTFEPLSFNENLDLASKYASSGLDEVMLPSNPELRSVPDISLPAKRKKQRPKLPPDPDSGVTDMGTSSEEDSYESSSSISDAEDLPPRLPWDTKKRKRSSDHEQVSPSKSAIDREWGGEEDDNQGDEILDAEKISEVVHALTRWMPGVSSNFINLASQSSDPNHGSALLSAMEELFELSKLDLVYVAQIVSEQAVSAIPKLLTFCENLVPLEDTNIAAFSAIQALVEYSMEHVFPNINDCDVAKLALVKEPPQRQMTNPGKAPQTGHPRPPHREGSMQLGPDYFAIPPPYVHIQRGADKWEMLPPALSFWDALGLAPAGGAKDIRTIGVVPDNLDLVGLVRDFIKDLGSAYESRKLGSFADPVAFEDQLNEVGGYDDGFFLISVDEEHLTFDAAMKAYASVCEDIGNVLCQVGHHDPDRTIVVFLLDPFENERSMHFLSACFWMLCKAYRKIHNPFQKGPRSDLVLQILPVSLIASPDNLVSLDPSQMGVLATELYDRCPPSSKAALATDVASALPMLAAPAVELANIPPKMIKFQLSSDPPSDILHEGSVLHVGYALSADQQWMTVCWIDSTARYQMTISACLRGKTFADVAADIWERTLEILTARDVTWRIWIVSNVEMEASVQKCWRALVASKPRRQMLHVTLLSVQTDHPLQLMPPDGSNTASNLGRPGVGFLTPGSTPQATTMTVSPDASGQTINVPPTPAPTEPLPGVLENDPDAHLVDLTDDSWAMLLTPSYASPAVHSPSLGDKSRSTNAALAKGILFRRGELESPDTDGRLESLGVSLHWDIRLRPNGAVDEGPAKQAEVTLREVLRMYRHLGLLTRVRNLDYPRDGTRDGRGNAGMLPVHVASAARAAEALTGLLS